MITNLTFTAVVFSIARLSLCQLKCGCWLDKCMHFPFFWPNHWLALIFPFPLFQLQTLIRINLFIFFIPAPHSHSFPGHQPEIDSQKQKAIYNSWETTSRSSYVDPKIRTRPTQTPQTSQKASC